MAKQSRAERKSARPRPWRAVHNRAGGRDIPARMVDTPGVKEEEEAAARAALAYRQHLPEYLHFDPLARATVVVEEEEEEATTPAPPGISRDTAMEFVREHLKSINAQTYSVEAIREMHEPRFTAVNDAVPCNTPIVRPYIPRMEVGLTEDNHFTDEEREQFRHEADQRTQRNLIDPPLDRESAYREDDSRWTPPADGIYKFVGVGSKSGPKIEVLTDSFSGKTNPSVGSAPIHDERNDDPGKDSEELSLRVKDNWPNRKPLVGIATIGIGYDLCLWVAMQLPMTLAAQEDLAKILLFLLAGFLMWLVPPAESD